MSEQRSPHLTDAQLDDYADGAMSDVERAAAERHLASCEPCTRAVGETRAVLAWATRERAAVTAPAELWPLVASSTIHLAEVRRAVIRSMRGVLVAGAIALIAATAMITWKVARWTAGPSAAPTQVHAGHPAGGGSHPTAPRAPIAPSAPVAPRPEGP